MILKEDRSRWLLRFKARFGVDLVKEFGSDWFETMDEVDLMNVYECEADAEVSNKFGIA